MGAEFLSEFIKKEPKAAEEEKLVRAPKWWICFSELGVKEEEI